MPLVVEDQLAEAAFLDVTLCAIDRCRRPKLTDMRIAVARLAVVTGCAAKGRGVRSGRFGGRVAINAFSSSVGPTQLEAGPQSVVEFCGTDLSKALGRVAPRAPRLAGNAGRQMRLIEPPLVHVNVTCLALRWSAPEKAPLDCFVDTHSPVGS
jgi:hypothetical protein